MKLYNWIKSLFDNQFLGDLKFDIYKLYCILILGMLITGITVTF